MPEFSFVIPAYNEENWIGPCIRAIRNAARANHLSHEIIVVNNHSTDRTVARARAANASVLEEPVRQIARVRNRGAEKSRGSYLVFVDADTLISADLVRRTAEELRSGTVVGGGSLISADRELSAYQQWGIDVWNTISERFRLAAGSYLFCRRSAFRKVGGFNEWLYASEELDLSIKLKRHGHRTGTSFVIITDDPVVTSARKLEWYPAGTLLLNLILCFLMPWAVYVKSLCWFWYDRP